MAIIKKLEVEFEDGRILIEKWVGDFSNKPYETVEVHGTVDLADLEKAIAIYKGENKWKRRNRKR